MIWTGRTDEARALGLLLDRTYADAAAAAEHPRLLDREFLIGQFDLWDNHLLPAMHAGTAPPWTRRAAARLVWQRLGFVAGPDHRRWMADHLDGLGLDPVALLGAERGDRPPFRDGNGRLSPTTQPITAEAAELIRADYDLTGGSVVGARMDLDGPDPQRISGFLKVSVGSRLYTDADAAPAELHFRFGDARALGFPHAGRGEVQLSGPPAFEVTGGGVSLDVPGLRLAGPDVTWYPDDLLWEESAAARVAGEGDYVSAPELPQLPARGVDLLGLLQLMIMLRLRLMQHAHLLRRWELGAAAVLCGGLNAELFRVRPTALRARWAARRMRTILATQDSQAHALLGYVGRRLHIEVPALPGAAVPPAPERITVGTAARLLGALDFAGARLRFVDVAPDRTVIHLDVRRGGRETIVVVVLTEPLGCAPLAVTPDGLILTGRPTLEATADDIALTIPLPGGDWTVRAAAGSWYVD